MTFSFLSWSFNYRCFIVFFPVADEKDGNEEKEVAVKDEKVEEEEKEDVSRAVMK